MINTLWKFLSTPALHQLWRERSPGKRGGLREGGDAGGGGGGHPVDQKPVQVYITPPKNIILGNILRGHEI